MIRIKVALTSKLGRATARGTINSESISANFALKHSTLGQSVEMRLYLKSTEAKSILTARFEEGSIEETELECCFLTFLYASSTKIENFEDQSKINLTRFHNVGDFISFSYSCELGYFSAKLIEPDAVLLTVLPIRMRGNSRTRNHFIEILFDRKNLLNFAKQALKVFEDISISSGNYETVNTYDFPTEDRDGWRIEWRRRAT